MEKMNKEELLQYLQLILDCENKIKKYDEDIKKLEDEIKGLSVYEEIKEPEKPKLPNLPAKLQRVKKSNCKGIKFKNILKWSILLGFVSAVFYLLIWVPPLNIDSMLTDILSYIASGIRFGAIATTLLSTAGVIVNNTVKSVNANIKNRENIRKYNLEMKEYKKQVMVVKKDYGDKMANYHQLLEKNELRHANEQATRTEFQNNLQNLKKRKASTAEVLSNLYKMNILPHKYQHFAAVTSIYENLSNGLTRSLEFSNNDLGAYNLYEQESRRRS